ncbi:MAG: nodulation protein E [Gammaproteobacteria bacterium]|nr:nodulation protein E [Gammaproteobacteria bacterium]
MPKDDKPLSRSELHGPARVFAEFCDAEFERRRNSDETFDENTHQEAMDIVLRKLNGVKEQNNS